MKSSIKLCSCVLLSVCLPVAVTAATCAAFDLAVVGPIKWADGIGRQSIGLIDCLKDDLTINFVHTHSRQELCLTDVPASVKEIITNRTSGYSNVIILEDVLSNGNPAGVEYYYKKMPEGHIKIAYTMFESTALPDEWADILNNNFDAAVVPDDFLVNVYKKAGVTIPIFVLPLGIYIEALLELPEKIAAHTPFTFAFSGTFSSRKNHRMVLESFAQAFGNDPNVRLVLHGRNDNETYKSLVRRCKELQLSNVEIICKSFTWNDYLEFLKNSDAYVSFSTGEGFAITPREAMAAGIPCIVSESTAQKTICNSNCVRPVPATITQPAYYPHLQKHVGYDFNVAVKDATAALLDVYQNYNHYLSKARAGRTWVRGYLYKNLRPYYLNLVKPRAVVLGDHNEITADKLITNSPELYQKYCSLRPVDPTTAKEATDAFQPQATHIDFDSLNPTFTTVNDADIIGAYRVMVGVPIPPHDFIHFKTLSQAYRWDFTLLAHHLLAMLETQEHLKIPSLASVATFPIHLHNGMTIFGYETDIFIAGSIAQHGYWEPDLEKVMRKIIRPGDTVMDIGANIGYFTAVMAECTGKEGRVYAVEALTPLAKLIETSKKYNNWFNVTVYPYALSNAHDTAYFLVNSINPGGSCIVSPEEAAIKSKIRPQSIIEVATYKLDILLEQAPLNRLDYIKMDVEGAESLVLDGARETISHFKPKITMEFSPLRYRHRGIEPVEVLTKLQHNGYSFDIMGNVCDQDDPCQYVLQNGRDPAELVAWIDQKGLEHVDIFMCVQP